MGLPGRSIDNPNSLGEYLCHFAESRVIDFGPGEILALASPTAFKSSEVRSGAFLAPDCCASPVVKQSANSTTRKVVDIVGFIVCLELLSYGFMRGAIGFKDSLKDTRLAIQIGRASCR